MIRRFILLLAVVIGGCSQMKETAEPMQFDSPAASPSAEPFLFTAGDGTVYLSWIEKRDTISELRFSKFSNNAWSKPVVIASGSTWFVNWADYPMIAANGNDLVAHYLDKSGDGTFAYDVKVTTSSDEGATWAQPFVLHDDGKQAEHGFVSLLPYDDNFFVTWLDGRNTVMEGIEKMDHHEGHHGQMSLRAAVLDKTGKKLNEWGLDDRTCDCCQTSSAMTDNGPVVVYRDRSSDETRDISIVRFVNGEWTKPESIHNDNWNIKGCPVNGPRVVSKGNKVVVVWFSAPDRHSQVNVSFSDNGGETFGEPIKIDEGNTIGRVDIAMLDDGRLFVVWMEGTEIKGAQVTNDGKGESVTIASSSEARSGGFPQITSSGNDVVAAWTDDKAKTVRTALIKI